MKFIQIALAFVTIFVLGTREAHAYLEPGSGSYLLQLLIGGGVGGLFVIKTFWLQIKSFFTVIFFKKKKSKSAPKKKRGK